MGRKKVAARREILPDPKFNDLVVAKFVNSLMKDGKKSVALSSFYSAMDMIQEKFPERPAIEVFTTAVENCRPSIEVRSKRVGGANYQVPTPVNSKRQQTLAIRWILEACRDKKGRPIDRRLADELMAAFRREGAAITKRENVHRMADANKAFAHFAW